MSDFTPISAISGGALIGLGASLLLLVNGRVAGVSGIFSGVLRPVQGETAWRIMFLAGIAFGAAIYASGSMPFELRVDFPPALLAVAGFLVGIGTRMGSGCTSGHGVCGLARLSARSLVATVTFLVTAALTASLLMPLLLAAL